MEHPVAELSRIELAVELAVELAAPFVCPRDAMGQLVQAAPTKCSEKHLCWLALRGDMIPR